MSVLLERGLPIGRVRCRACHRHLLWGLRISDAGRRRKSHPVAHAAAARELAPAHPPNPPCPPTTEPPESLRLRSERRSSGSSSSRPSRSRCSGSSSSSTTSPRSATHALDQLGDRRGLPRLRRRRWDPQVEGHRLDRGLFRREQEPGVVGGRPQRHGDAALGRNDDRNHGTGRDRRHSLRADLPRLAPRDGHPRRDDRADVARLRCLHRLRVPGEALRREDALADRVPLPPVPGDVLRDDPRSACRGLQRDLRAPPRLERHAHRHTNRHLHDDRRGPSRGVGGREADGPHRLRARRCDGRSSGADAREPRRRPAHRRLHGSPTGLRLLPRHQRDLHVLVGRHRRNLPHVVVFRHRPEPGTALPHRALRGSGEELPPDERVLEDPPPGSRPPRGCRSLRLLPVRPTPAPLQPGTRGGRHC